MPLNFQIYYLLYDKRLITLDTLSIDTIIKMNVLVFSTKF